MREQEPPALGTSFALFVASCVFQLLFLEKGASLYDEGSIVAVADGLSQGEVLYRDRVTFVAPFAYELMGVLYRIFGPHLLVGRVVVVFTFAMLVAIVHRILLKILPPAGALMGALAIWPVKPLGFPLWSILNYQQVALLFEAATIWAGLAWLRGRSRAWLVATGVAVGFTIISKQDYGAYIALAVTIAVVFDWLVQEQRRSQALVGTLGTLGFVAAIPVLATFLFYAARGAGPAFIQRTVLDLVGVPGEYGVPFPGLRPWLEDPDRLFMVVFAYFPAAFIEMAWGGRLNVYDRSQLLPLEVVIKAAYYFPIAAMIGLAVAAVRGGPRLERHERGGLVLLTAAAAIGYALIFRADWIHLMNLYIIVLLPVTVALGRWVQRGRAWRWVPVAVLWVVWMGFGVAATYAIRTVYTEPVHTARGRVYDVPRKAVDLQTVVDFLETEPPENRVFFLPHNPLLYFVSGRRILAPHDIAMPALIANVEDDRVLAEAVETADLVVYNPKIFPTAPSALYEYAPLTATVLSRRFAPERVLSNTEIALRKIPGGPPEIVVDFWSDNGEDDLPPVYSTYAWNAEAAASAPPVFRAHWMVYRIVAMQVLEENVEQCFSRRHCVSGGEMLTAMPATHPEGWGLPVGKEVVFSIRAQIGAETVPLFVRGWDSSFAPQSIEVPLEALAGQCVDLHFCAKATESGVPFGLAGWAEPRIERRSVPTAGR